MQTQLSRRRFARRARARRLPRSRGAADLHSAGFLGLQGVGGGDAEPQAGRHPVHEGNHYIAAFRYELPAAGGLIASAKPVNRRRRSRWPSTRRERQRAHRQGEPGKKAEANDLQAGTYYGR